MAIFDVRLVSGRQTGLFDLGSDECSPGGDGDKYYKRTCKCVYHIGEFCARNMKIVGQGFHDVADS